ncbi:lipid II flippase MurJ [Francisella sp. 19X1-34]|uniref:murein biosynthesis integral membrane protein MurJ n=1 Tax=Francisella sp. 19X1-34 TaxID=3087177 RepID=UPI002E345468|nr:lipid II flippase MurJ [Francisella sp. 19X1-34]MED7788022.1 lipid II flippase MurJ [Francisella sp. 19X1-34]
MKKTAFILVLLSLLSKPLGFIRQLLISYFFGATNITDAYFIASSALGIALIYFSAVSTSFIPTYNKIQKESGIVKANDFTNKLISIQLLLSLFMVFLIFIFADYFIVLLASGFDQKTIEIAKKFLIILSLSAPLIVISNELSSFLNIKERYIQKALAQYTGHIFILFVILAGLFSYYLLAVGQVFSYFLFLLILLVLSYRQGLFFKIKLSYDENVRYAFIFAFPVVLNNSIVLINQVVDQNIGSRLGEGVISAINYSASLQGVLVFGIIDLILTNIAFPKLSKLAQNDKSEAVLVYNKILIALECIVIPISFLFIFFAKDIISFVYLRGAFGSIALDNTSTVLSIISISFPFMAYSMLCTRMLFAFHISKLLIILSLVIVISNIIFSIVLSYFFGLVGLICGTVISSILGSCTSAIIFKYKIAKIELKKLFLKIFKIVLVCLIIVYFAYILREQMLHYFSNEITTMIYISVSGLLYLFLIQVVSIEEVVILRKSVINYLRRKTINK